ncbi:MAG: M56 family metallopeptidase [Cyanobacteria bacterium J06638_38]
MHLLVMLMMALLAAITRCQPKSSSPEWSKRWERTLFLFLFPSLLLFTTASTILYMGCHGEMLGVRAGSLGCIISGILIILSLISLLRLIYLGNRSIRQLANYRQQTVGSTTAKVLDTNLPYSAQIGFWHSRLIISTGLLDVLDDEHLAAVIAHEQAHLFYRDTFWFFWFGWIRSFSFWLPNTEVLWQELLLLRELRADSKAAESVDFLLLAESLLTVAKAPLENTYAWCVSLNDSQIGDRLNERIDCLLREDESISSDRWYSWSWLSLLLLPLLAIPLHY